MGHYPLTLRSLFARITKLSEESIPTALGLFFYNFNVIFGLFVIARIAGRTLYVARLPEASLPFMYIGGAVSAVLAALLYAQLSARFSRRALALGSLGLFAVVLASFRFAANIHSAVAYATIFFCVEAMCSISMIEFWSLASDLFTSREAKRAFSFVGLGGIVASLAAFLVRKWAPLIGTEDLLFWASGHILIAVACVAAITRTRAALPRSQRRRANPSPREVRALSRAAREARGRTHVIALGLLTACTAIAASLIDFQFNRTAKSALAEKQIADLLAKLLGTSGALSFGIQLLVTGKLLERFGVLSGLLALPLAYTTAFIAYVMNPGIGSASLAKSSELVLRYTIHDATTQLLYVPLPTEMRMRAKLLVDGIVKPLSIGLAGIALLGLLSPLGSTRAIVIATFCALGLWIAMVFWNRREYVRSLLASLQRQTLEVDTRALAAAVAADRTHVEQRLGSSRPEVVISALELLKGLPDLRSWIDVLHGPLAHVDTGVQATALALLEHPSLSPDTVLPFAQAALSSPEERIRDTAAALLIHSTATEARRAAARYAGDLAKGSDPALRLRALRIVDRSRRAGADALLVRLLHDVDDTVQLAAIATAGRRADTGLAAPLVDFLAEPKLRTATTNALRHMASAAEPALLAALADAARDERLRGHVAVLLGSLAAQNSQTAMDALVSALDSDTPVAVRHAAGKAAATALRTARGLTANEKTVEHALDHSMAHWKELSRCRTDLGNTTQAVTMVLDDRIAVQCRHALHLLELRYPHRKLEAATALFESNAARGPQVSGVKRANAIELIENLVPERFGRQVVGLLEPRKDTEQSQSTEKWILKLTRSSDDLLAAAALLSAGASHARAAEDLARERLNLGGRLTREVAAKILAQAAC